MGLDPSGETDFNSHIMLSLFERFDLISIVKSQADLFLKCTDKKYLFVDFELYALKNQCLDSLNENECKLFEVYMFMSESVYKKLEAKAKS